MRLLSIGNSFSQDAQKWLSQIAKSDGENLEVVNLMIGGCSLETHMDNFKYNKPNYYYEVNGNDGDPINTVSINDTLKNEKWDAITMQQVSQNSGMYETIEPYLADLYAGVKELSGDAKFYYQQTWAYEIDSDHGGFANYNYNQREMFEKIVDAANVAAKSIGATIIPSGETIQYLRENTKEFDYKNGGLSLNRDGFHLSFLYGRYTAALTWYGVLFGKDIRNVSFIPEVDGEVADANLLKIINNAVYEVLNR